MRPQSEIAQNIRLSNVNDLVDAGMATVTLPSGFCGSAIWGRDEAGWEHVSVSSYKAKRLPSWDDMCRVKDIFFEDEEEAVQVHPKASRYLHGVSHKGETLENVLHLWRPKDGDWSRLNHPEEMEAFL